MIDTMRTLLSLEGSSVTGMDPVSVYLYRYCDLYCVHIQDAVNCILLEV